MKISTLRLLAFGPFTGLELDLGEQPGGLQLLYGPNEAGKSSALRAIRQLLYGIEVQTKDGFLHPYDRLRVGARLVRDDGRSLEFIRRKANKNSLRQPDDQTPLSDDDLSGWLPVSTMTDFQSRFGIDHERLREGGAEIVKGKGQLAETLFAATAGVAHLRQISDELRNGYQALYKPGGSKQRIAELRRELDAARKRLHELQLPGEEWKRLDESLQEKQQQRDKLNHEHGELNARQQRLTRLKTALPIAWRWQQSQSALESLQGVPLLRTGFAAEVTQSHADCDLQRKLLETAQAELQQIQDKLAAIPAVELDPAEVASIEDLGVRLGAYQQATSDRPKLVLKAEQAERDAAKLQSEFALSAGSAAINWQLSADRRVRIQDLGSRQQSLQDRQATLQDEVARLQRKVEQLQLKLQELPPAPDTAVLRQTVQRLRQAGDLEAERDELQADCLQRQRKWEKRLSLLPGWSGSIEELEQRAVPTDDRLRQLEQHWNDLQERGLKLRNRQQLHTDRLSELSDRLRQLETQGIIPTLTAVQRQREERDALWDSVRLQWSRQESYDAELTARVSNAIRTSDDLVDELQRESRRVAQKQELLTQQAQEQQQLDSLAEQLRALEADQISWNEQTTAVWPGVSPCPATPRDMRDWLKLRTELLAEWEQWQILEAQREKSVQQVQRARQDLNAAAAMFSPAWSTDSSSLQVALASVEADLQRQETGQRLRQQYVAALDETEAELQASLASQSRAQEEWTTFAREWDQAIASLGVRSQATAAEVFKVLEVRDQHEQLLNQAAAFRERIEAIDHDNGLFAAAVEQVFRRCLADEPPTAVVEQVQALSRWLRDQQTLAKQRLTLEQQAAEQQTRVRKLQEKFATAAARFQTLCHEAGCQDLAELTMLIPQSDRRREQQTARDDAEQQLSALSAGSTVSAFLQEIAEIDPDQLPGEIEALTAREQQLRHDLSQLDQTIGQLRSELSQMQGQGTAAEQATQCQMLITDLQEAVREYAVLRLSAAVLQRGMERYRDRHQGPLLSRAGDLFARLSCGSFAGLRPEIDDKGVPILVGVRPESQQTVKVDQMSDGACDQLYLALRIAVLEEWLGTHESMPFIVDDILLNFDDERAAVALEILGELSRRTQVLFLTHHHRLVELARKAMPADLLTVHHLKA